ncbi:hypothetical protein SFUMM280S_09035 [Streptomyces fumanus]
MPRAILAPEAGTSEGGRRRWTSAEGFTRSGADLRGAGLEPRQPIQEVISPGAAAMKRAGEKCHRGWQHCRGPQGGCRYCSGTASISSGGGGGVDALGRPGTAGAVSRGDTPLALPARVVRSGGQAALLVHQTRRGTVPMVRAERAGRSGPGRRAHEIGGSGTVGALSRYRHALAVPLHNMRHDRDTHSWVGQGRTRGLRPVRAQERRQGISRAWSRRRELPRTDGDRAAIQAKDFDLEPLESYPGPSGLRGLPPPPVRPRCRDQVEQPQARPSGLPVLPSLPGVADAAGPRTKPRPSCVPPTWNRSNRTPGVVTRRGCSAAPAVGVRRHQVWAAFWRARAAVGTVPT